ncbi:hypothetical protein BKA61DRAFT_648106 [Leptodontidium sp. MPI-SDFR-AT-0119]|nr:hypothetical protein BKA61DRAFT_648106 [Leptodontidium sp. MPI-SDFR-AT-0119]
MPRNHTIDLEALRPVTMAAARGYADPKAFHNVMMAAAEEKIDLETHRDVRRIAARDNTHLEVHSHIEDNTDRRDRPRNLSPLNTNKVLKGDQQQEHRVTEKSLVLLEHKTEDRVMTRPSISSSFFISSDPVPFPDRTCKEFQLASTSTSSSTKTFVQPKGNQPLISVYCSQPNAKLDLFGMNGNNRRRLKAHCPGCLRWYINKSGQGYYIWVELELDRGMHRIVNPGLV